MSANICPITGAVLKPVPEKKNYETAFQKHFQKCWTLYQKTHMPPECPGSEDENPKYESDRVSTEARKLHR